MRIGVVGCGDIARVHARFIVADPRHSVAGVCDEDEKKAERLAETIGCRNIYRDLGSLLEEQKPDVVHVLTPPQSHAALAIRALRASCHVLVEKPMALSLEQADEMITAAKQGGVKLCVNHNQLFEPVVLKARRLVEEGNIGTVIFVESYYGFNLAQTAARRWVSALPGGVFQNLAPHPLSLILHFLQGPLEVSVASFASGVLGSSTPDELRVLMKAGNGLGTVSLSLGIKPHLNFVRIYGSRAVLHVDLANMILSAERLRPLPKVAARGLMSVEHGAQIALGAAGTAFKMLSGRLRPYQGLGDLIAKFYESIEQGHESPVTGEAGRRVVEVFERIRAKLPTPSPRSKIPRRRSNGSPTVLITGATGFVGGHLAERLTGQGLHVRALVRPTSRVDRLAALDVECIEGDLTDLDSLERAVQGCDVVYHCGATTRGPWSDYAAGTIRGTEAVLQASAAARVKRLVYLSSLSVYAVEPSVHGDLVTEDAPLEPHPEERGYYTQSKVEAERLALAYHARAELPIVILRPGTVYGPRGKVFSPRVGYSLKNKIFVIIGRGTNILPLVFVENLIDALCLAGSREGAIGHIYNIVDDDSITQREYLTELLRRTGRTALTIRVPISAMSLTASSLEAYARLVRREPVLSRYRLASATKDLRYDTSHAKVHLGWKPNVSLYEGLRKTFEWYTHELRHS